MRPNTSSILKPLDRIAGRGHSFTKVYSDWLTMSCCAFTGGQQEELYLETMRPYLDNRERGERNADLFCEALAEWQLALQTEFRDYLGDIFEERITHGEKGQFFTPEPLCDLLADLPGAELKDGQIVNDPAVGSGRTLISATRKNRNAIFIGGDLDVNCVRMTALNLLCRNVDGVVLWQDTIKLEAWGGYRLIRTPLGGSLRWIEKEEAQRLLESPLRAAQAEREELATQHSPEPEKTQQEEIEEELEERQQYSFSL